MPLGKRKSEPRGEEGGRPVGIWIRFVRKIDSLSAAIGRAASWLTLAMVLVTVSDVLMRYFFKAGSIAVQEIEWHLFSANFLLAAAWTLLCNGHVRVDLLRVRMSERKQAWIDFLGGLFFLIPFCVVVAWASIPFVYDAWSTLEGSSDPGGLPARYLLKTLIPAAYVLLGLQGFSQVIKNLYFLRGKGDSP
jgi:TRAP-type mannitol/chloroaromatic compound transport system permease small subunit